MLTIKIDTPFLPLRGNKGFIVNVQSHFCLIEKTIEIEDAYNVFKR
tara:strand:+ start:1997 stop:2134 length:138 start_codon:yes stop_codon:yes gene_type:complete